MSDLPLLYIADAEASFCEQAKAELSRDFEVRCFADGMSCIALLSEKPPAILILNNNIRDTSVLDLCRDIRDDDRLHDIHIFLLYPAGTHHESIEQAHAIGADDALTEPINLPNLRRQLRTTHRLTSERSSLKQQANYAQQVAMTAMTSMGELGVVLQFLSKCFTCNQAREVALECLSAIGQYGLNGSVQIRTWDQNFTESTSDGKTTEDDAIISKLHGIGRIFEFKTRMIFNYEHTSILLNDVVDDNEVRGRIRDNVAMLAEGANTRITSLLIEQDNRRKQSGIQYALSEIIDMATDLEEHQHNSQARSQQAVNEVIHNFETAFIRMGLTPEQESDLITLLVELRQEVSTLGLSASEIDQKLQRIVRSLQSIAEERF